MYKDIISYTLSEGTSLEHLLEVAGKVRNLWMKEQEWCQGWEITQDVEGNLTDIVYRASKEHADQANKNMATMANAQEWMACYDMSSISSKGVQIKKSFSA